MLWSPQSWHQSWIKIYFPFSQCLQNNFFRIHLARYLRVCLYLFINPWVLLAYLAARPLWNSFLSRPCPFIYWNHSERPRHKGCYRGNLNKWMVVVDELKSNRKMPLCWLLPWCENADIICICNNSTHPHSWMDFHGPMLAFFCQLLWSLWWNMTSPWSV